MGSCFTRRLEELDSLKKKPDKPVELSKVVRTNYGIHIPAGVTLHDWQLELLAFKLGWEAEDGGLGKYEHLRKACDIIYPGLVWNEWLERMIRGFCDNKYAYRSGDTSIRVISLVGVAAAGKTFAMGMYAFLWWVSDPEHSIAVLTSTTKGAVGQRVWPVIQKFYHDGRRSLAARHKVKEESVLCFGNLVDSRKVLQSQKGKDDRAIFAQAVKGGETSKAEAFIQGQHAPRMLVAIDEANETPEAIFSVVSNWRKGCLDLTVIVAGNPMSRLDPHARCCAPKGGWGMRPEHEAEWATEGIPEWQLEPGLCLQFKGPDSPNVKAGRTVHPHIYSWENYQAALRPEVRNTLRYWRYDAGEWAPDGLCNTVFNETMATACGLRDSVIFLQSAENVSFLDPGFGGDACIQMIGRVGEIEVKEQERASWAEGLFPTGRAQRKVLMVTHVKELALDPAARDKQGKPLDYVHQIARQVIMNCQEHNVQPYNFGLYSTGTGMGIASVLFIDWSNQILKVEEGGKPSERPTSHSDRRPACEVYDRRVSELWFSARVFAEGRQLFGLDNATLVELCAREYEMVGKPFKYSVETKDEFKPKLGHSPDRGDCLCGLVELVRVRHGVVGGGDAAERVDIEWNEQAYAVQKSMEAEYSSGNESEMLAGIDSM